MISIIKSIGMYNSDRREKLTFPYNIITSIIILLNNNYFNYNIIYLGDQVNAYLHIILLSNNQMYHVWVNVCRNVDAMFLFLNIPRLTYSPKLHPFTLKDFGVPWPFKLIYIYIYIMNMCIHYISSLVWKCR